MNDRLITYFICLFSIIWPLGLRAEEGMPERHELSLSEALAFALQNNAELKGGEAKIDRARASETLAGAPFLPQGRLEAGYTYLEPVPEITMELPGPGATLNRRTIPMGYADNRRLSFVLSQNIFSFWADSYQREAARHALEGAKHGAKKIRDETAFETARGFYMILFLREQVLLMEQTIEDKKIHLGEVEANFRAGVATELDKLSTQVALQELIPEYEDVKNKLTLAELAFARTLGVDEASRPVPRQGKIPFRPLQTPLVELEKRALAESPLLAGMSQRTEMLAAQRDALAARDKPTIGIAAKADYGRPSNNVDEWGNSYALMLTATWTLFDGFATRGRVGEVAADLAENRFAGESARQGVLLALHGAYYNAKNAEVRMTSIARSLALAQKAHKIALVGYQHGTVTSNDVRDAQTGVLRAELYQVKTLYDHVVARLELGRALGATEEIITTLQGDVP